MSVRTKIKKDNLKLQLKPLQTTQKSLKRKDSFYDDPTKQNCQQNSKRPKKRCVEFIDSAFEKIYETTEKLGQGYQSYVRKVIHRDNANNYAVKVMRDVDEEGIYHITKQFRMLRDLNCDMVAKVHELYISEKESECRLVMEYCPFPQLRQHMRAVKMREQMAAGIIQAIFEAVHYIHSRGVCHRDLKPENILYCPDSGRLKLIDFNVAREIDCEMVTSTGTIFYKAPQIFHGGYSEKVDVWAVGVVAYQMLHGKLPFWSTQHTETIQEIVEVDIEKIIDPNLSPMARQFLKKCLCKDPTNRPTANEALKEPFLLCLSTQDRSCSLLDFDKLDRSYSSKTMSEQTRWSFTSFVDTIVSPIKKNKKRKLTLDQSQKTAPLDETFGIMLVNSFL